MFIAACALAFILILVLFGMSNAFASQQGEPSPNTGGGASGGAVDCSANVKVPANLYPFVKAAAAANLNGDEAALIALVEVESASWDPKSHNPSGASGLGQFMYNTAKEMPEFCNRTVFGGADCERPNGKSWKAGIVDENNNPEDARYDPERSLFAAAFYLADKLKKYNNDLGEAYEYGYHTHGNGDPATITAAKDTRAKIERIYSELLAGGGCKEMYNSYASTVGGNAFHLVDFSGNSSGYSKVRNVSVDVIKQYGYDPRNGVGSKKTNTPCDSTVYGCWNYEVYRSKDAEIAGNIVATALAVVGNEKLPDLGDGSPVTYAQSVKKCTTLVYYVMKQVGRSNFYGADALSSYGDSFELVPAPAAAAQGVDLKPGDVVHFNLPGAIGTGYSFNRTGNQHWAIAVP